MDRPDLSDAKRRAEEAASAWGVELGEPFAMSNYSFVAPVDDTCVLKVAWSGDEESLHEPEAFELWNGDGAVRVYRSDPSRRALLEERAIPGTDISALDDDEATAIAVGVATVATGRRTVPARHGLRTSMARERAERPDAPRAPAAGRARADERVARARRLPPSQHPAARRGVRGDRSQAVPRRARVRRAVVPLESGRLPVRRSGADREAHRGLRRGRSRRLSDQGVDGDPRRVSAPRRPGLPAPDPRAAGLEEEAKPDRLALAVEVRVAAVPAVPARERDEAEARERGRERDGKGGEKLGIAHPRKDRHDRP